MVSDGTAFTGSRASAIGNNVVREVRQDVAQLGKCAGRAA
jgi:hypothetical protein